MAEFDITKHSLVPKQEIISNEEKEALFKLYNISETQLPKILTTDPTVKTLQAKEGDIIKIIRESKTAGTAIYYRIVSKLIR